MLITIITVYLLNLVLTFGAVNDQLIRKGVRSVNLTPTNLLLALLLCITPFSFHIISAGECWDVSRNTKETYAELVLENWSWSLRPVHVNMNFIEIVGYELMPWALSPIVTDIIKETNRHTVDVLFNEIKKRQKK